MAGGVLLNPGDVVPARRSAQHPKAASTAWLLLSALLGGGALLAWWLPSAWLDWQPDLAAGEPWRAWSAAWVHWSPLHLGANLAGLAVLAALGREAALPREAALAWGLAWPMTQAALLVRPELAHYGGLSGVLHAGVAVAALWLLAGPDADAGAGRDTDAGAGSSSCTRSGGDKNRQAQAAGARTPTRNRNRSRRRIGAAIAMGLLAKLLLERPWGPALQHPDEWDIAIAPLAHAAGALAGGLCAVGALAVARVRGVQAGRHTGRWR